MFILINEKKREENYEKRFREEGSGTLFCLKSNVG